MGFRTLEIGQAAEIHIKEGQLEVATKEGTAYSHISGYLFLDIEIFTTLCMTVPSEINFILRSYRTTVRHKTKHKFKTKVCNLW